MATDVSHDISRWKLQLIPTKLCARPAVRVIQEAALISQPCMQCSALCTTTVCSGQSPKVGGPLHAVLPTITATPMASIAAPIPKLESTSPLRLHYSVAQHL